MSFRRSTRLRETSVDFPHATELGVAIRGVAAGALIFEVVLSLQRRDVELPGLQGDQGG